MDFELGFAIESGRHFCDRGPDLGLNTTPSMLAPSDMPEGGGLTQFLSNDELVELLSAFPAVEFAFAYGSGVVQQQVRNY